MLVFYKLYFFILIRRYYNGTAIERIADELPKVVAFVLQTLRVGHFAHLFGAIISCSQLIKTNVINPASACFGAIYLRPSG